MFINRRDNQRPSLGALIAVPLLALSLAACTPSGEEGTTPSGGGGGSSSDTSDSMAWELDFAACMRKQGLDYPDPEPGAGGIISFGSVDSDRAAWEAASEKCFDELGERPALSPQEQAAADKEFLAWAKKAAECYRENGYDMPDPDGTTTLSFPADAPAEVAQECGGGGAAVTRTEP